MLTSIIAKEVQIVYRLFLVNYYLLHVPRLPSQPAMADLESFYFPHNFTATGLGIDYRPGINVGSIVSIECIY